MWGNGTRIGFTSAVAFATVVAVLVPLASYAGPSGASSNGLSGVIGVASDGQGYCAELNTGGVDCWGLNTGGQLGDGNFNQNSASPVPVSGVGGTGLLSGVVSLVGGANGYCALLSTGSVDCWGQGYYGQLGNGLMTQYEIGPGGSASPVQVIGVGGSGILSGVASLFGKGQNTFCAVLTSGGVDCWGEGDHGELGNGTIYNTFKFGGGPYVLGNPTPVEVLGVGGSGTLSGVASLAGTTDTMCRGLDLWRGRLLGSWI